MYDDDDLESLRESIPRGPDSADDTEGRVSPRTFATAFSLATASAAVLIYLTLSTVVAAGVLPVVGIGGYVADIGHLEGNDGKMYPVMGNSTETSECREVPMLAIEMEDAYVEKYDVYKDIKLPIFPERWMTIKVEQPANSTIDANNVTLHTTQMSAGYLEMYNAKLHEGGGDVDWGENSDEIRIETDPFDQRNPDIVAHNVTAWLHLTSFEKMDFSAQSSVEFGIEYPNTTELRAQREEHRIQKEVAREDYMTCLPDERSKIHQSFESLGEAPPGWDVYDGAGVNDMTSNFGDYSAYTCCQADSRVESPGVDLSGEGFLEVTAHYWIRKGGSFSDPPQSDLVVEYLDDSGTWRELETVGHSSVSDGEAFKNAWSVPRDGLHSNFRIRFRQKGGSGSDTEYWHIDDVVVE